jgi:predicted helicase
MNFENINNFQNFCQIINKYESKEKGDNFEVLCKYVILLHYIFNNEIQNCWLYKDIPHNVSIKLKLPNNDKGIDILLEYKTGKYAVVQCKYRSYIEKKVTYTELSTFFSQILQYSITRYSITRYSMNNLVTNILQYSDIPNEIKKKILKNFKEIYYNSFNLFI